MNHLAPEGAFNTTPVLPFWLCGGDDPFAVTSAAAAGAKPLTGKRAKPLVMIIEDSRADVALVQEALTEHAVDCDILSLSDGEKAISHLMRVGEGEADCPALIVLDLNLPRRHGRDVLKSIRANPKCHSVPVVVLSSSSAPRDIQETTALGATQYIRKPMDLEEFMTIGLALKAFISVPGASS